METSVTIKIGTFEGSYFLKIVGGTFKNVYVLPISKRMAQRMEKEELMEIEELDFDPTKIIPKG